MKLLNKISVSLLTFILIFNLSGFGVTGTYADETAAPVTENESVAVLPSRPKVSLKVNGNSVTLTIKKTANAEGYLVFLKQKGDKIYNCFGQIESDGSQKRSFTFDNLPDGTYYVRVKAYNGTVASKYSKTAKAVINRVHSEILSSWEETAPGKKALVSYMQDITLEGGENFIPVENRIAVFDLDGTLYCETDPNYFDYMLLVHHVLEDEEYIDQASDFEKQVANDIVTLNETGKKAANMEVNHGKAITTSFDGYTPEEFYDYIAEFKKTPMRSYENMTLGEAFYVPMLEVVDFLRANDFTVYVVSGTDRFIVRGLLKDSKLKVPNDHIIGSDRNLVATGQGETNGLDYVFTDKDKVVFGEDFIVKNLKMNKVSVIVQEIGIQPVLSFGNSTGDSSMAEYVTTDNKYPSLALMLCCDDTERENGKLSSAENMYDLCEEFDWIPVSMKNDWKTIYEEGVKKVR